MLLGAYPTPLEPLGRLSAALNGPALYVKRDDLTGLAFGGNKTRSLEYVLGDVMNERPDVLVTGASVQSNWCRQSAAAAAKLGIPIVLVLRRTDMTAVQGNLLLDYMLGADVRFVDEPDLATAMKDGVDQTVTTLRAQGRHAVKIDPWAPSVALGYVRMMIELQEQCETMDLRPTHLWTAAAGPTHAGVVLGARLLDWPIKVIGVSPIEWSNGSMADLVASCANSTAELLEVDERFLPADFTCLDSYIGPGYAQPSPEGLAAIRLVARTEGLLLDPVYTGKAMAGLIDHIASGQLRSDDRVIFLHTGGLPAIFAFDRVLAASAQGEPLTS